MDFRIIGIGITITFAIIALSAITLYVAFRIKETFREEKSIKIQIAKTGFILGILFLAGGMFYFFAQALNQPEKLSNNTDFQGMIENQSAKVTSINLALSYPENVKIDETYTVSFRVYNSSSGIIHNASIKLMGLSLIGAKSNFNIDSDNLNLGDIQPEGAGGYLQLKAPSYPIMLEGALILRSEGNVPVTKSVIIKVVDINTTSITATPITSSIPTQTPTASPAPTPWYYIIWPPASTSTSGSSSGSTQPKETPLQTSTPTPASTVNATTSPTATVTVSPTATATVSPTATVTASPTATVTASPTATVTASPTATVTASPTATVTASPTAAVTASPTATVTASPTAAVTASPTAAVTASPTATATASPTATATASPTATATASPTATATASPTATATASPTATATASPTATATASPTATPTSTQTPTNASNPPPATTP